VVRRWVVLAHADGGRDAIGGGIGGRRVAGVRAAERCVISGWSVATCDVAERKITG
jgi:hypothetical protein